MRDTIRLGRIAGVQVGLNWTLVAMVAVVAFELDDNRFANEVPGHSGTAYAVAGCVTAIGLLVGVLLHELGHAVLAKRAGLEVDGITLSWMGGVTRIQVETVRPATEFAVAVIGPLVSLAFGGVLILGRLAAEGAGASQLVVASVTWLAAINIVLAAFNLLPGAPLDGGRVVHAAVWALTKDRWKATRLASSTGMGLGALVVVGGFVLMAHTHDPINGFAICLVGWWLIASARAELDMSAVNRALEDRTMADLMRPVGSAPGWITVRTFAEQYAGPRPGWVWLLERWGGGYEGILAGDALAGVPFHQWDMVRPIDYALPVSATMGASPSDDALDVLGQTAGRHVIIVVEDGRTVGAVLPSDVEALIRMAGRGGRIPARQPAPRSAR